MLTSESETKVQTEKSLAASLSGLLKYLFDRPGHESSIREALMGKTHQPLFRIPSADRGVEVFFNNRELLCRFAAMPLPSQWEFLQAVRAATEKEHVEVVYLDVAWSEKKTRKIKITLHKPDGHMDINV